MVLQTQGRAYAKASKHETARKLVYYWNLWLETEVARASFGEAPRGQMMKEAWSFSISNKDLLRWTWPYLHSILPLKFCGGKIGVGSWWGRGRPEIRQRPLGKGESNGFKNPQRKHYQNFVIYQGRGKGKKPRIYLLFLNGDDASRGDRKRRLCILVALHL